MTTTQTDHSAHGAATTEGTIARAFADFAVDTNFADLPQLAIEHAKVTIASTIASAAMGRDIGSSNALREMARERGGTPQATVWFDAGPKLPVMDAARTNATMSDAAASDDTDLLGGGHLGTVTSTTAVAMAERTGASGQDVLAGIVLGYEVAGRIGQRIRNGEVGFHPGVITIFSATVAAGKTMHLDREQMTHAIALAATSIGGNGVAANTSWAREYDATLASTLAITAAMAAEQGFTCEPRILEMPRGYFEVFKGHDLDSLLTDLGKTWRIVDDLAVKLMPGTWAYQALVEAAVNAANEGDVRPDEIEAVLVSRRPIGGSLLYRPKDLIGVAHSLPYMLAAGIVDREYTWAHATPKKYLDETIGRVQDKVQVGDFDAPQPYLGGGTVRIVTTSGRSYESTIAAPRGSGRRGIEWADIDAKYRALVPLADLAPARIEDTLRQVHELDRASSMSELMNGLQG